MEIVQDLQDFGANAAQSHLCLVDAADVFRAFRSTLPHLLITDPAVGIVGRTLADVCPPAIYPIAKAAYDRARETDRLQSFCCDVPTPYGLVPMLHHVRHVGNRSVLVTCLLVPEGVNRCSMCHVGTSSALLWYLWAKGRYGSSPAKPSFEREGILPPRGW